MTLAFCDVTGMVELSACGVDEVTGYFGAVNRPVVWVNGAVVAYVLSKELVVATLGNFDVKDVASWWFDELIACEDNSVVESTGDVSVFSLLRICKHWHQSCE